MGVHRSEGKFGTGARNGLLVITPIALPNFVSCMPFFSIINFIIDILFILLNSGDVNFKIHIFFGRLDIILSLIFIENFL